MRYTFYFLLILCFQDCGSCDLNPPNCERVYNFEIPFSVSPPLDTFHIGDTLMLGSFIPKMVEDRNTGELIDVHHHDFKIESSIFRMDTLIPVLSSISDTNFDYIHDLGFYEIRKFIDKVHYKKTDAGQELKIRILPKEPGVYLITFGNLTQDLQDVNLTEDKCRQNLTITFRMNEEGNENNFNLLLNSPMPVNWSEAYYETGSYAFVVVK